MADSRMIRRESKEPGKIPYSEEFSQDGRVGTLLKRADAGPAGH